MGSQRLSAWGAIGGLVAGILLAVGYLIALVLAARFDAANVVGTWLTTLGFVALVFAAIGFHEVLHAARAALAGTGAVLTVVGSIMMVAVSYIALGTAYGIGDEPLYLAPELIGFPVVGGVALMLGLALLGVAIIRSEPLPTAAGGLLLAAAAAVAVAAVAFAVGTPLPAVFYIGGLLIGIGVAWAGAALWSTQRRPPTDV